MAHVAGEDVVTEADDFAAKQFNHDCMTALMERDRDGHEDEKCRLIDQGAVAGGEVQIEQFFAAANDLPYDADANEHVEETDEREQWEGHVAPQSSADVGTSMYEGLADTARWRRVEIANAAASVTNPPMAID